MTTAPTTTIRLMLVDDSSIVRQGLRSAFTEQLRSGRFEIVAEAATGESALREAQLRRPDVVLLDLRLPDLHGVDVCLRLRDLLPECAVLVFTSSSDDQSVYRAIVAGAHGYLLKEVDPAALIKSVEDAAAGRPVLSPDLSGRMIDIVRGGHAASQQARNLTKLSQQERRVLEAMAAGETNKGIAEQLALSENTVKNYIGRLFDKLGVQRRSQAVALFLNRSDR